MEASGQIARPRLSAAEPLFLSKESAMSGTRHNSPRLAYLILRADLNGLCSDPGN